MTIDEALTYIERDGPLDQFSSLPNVIADVIAAIDAVDVSRDVALLARVRRLVNKASHYQIADALKRSWVRAELALGNHAVVAEAIWTSTYSGGYFAAAAGPDAWPLVRLLLDRGLKALGNSAEKLVELAAALVAPDLAGWEARFDELRGRSVAIAARALWHLRWSRNVEIAAIVALLLRHLDTPEGGEVADAIRAAVERGESLAPLVPMLDDTALSGPHAANLAYAFTLSSLRDGTASRWLDDPRPSVRLGAVRALAKDPRLIAFARDPDVTVRRAALEALSQRALEPADLEPLVSALEVAGEELADLLVVAVGETALLVACKAVGSDAARGLAASLRRQHGLPTRACARCRRLPRSESWTTDDRPKEIDELTTLAVDDERSLLRCPTCSACYASTYRCEIDVNSQHEAWTLRRLTLGELQRAHGADFVPDWSAALAADLDHPDPHWRTEAAYELAHDLVANRHFDRIERELLRHPRRQVPREALRILRAQAIAAPVSAAVLEALVASSDEVTRTLATLMLDVQRGTLDEGQLDSDTAIASIEVLLDRGAAITSRFAARLVDHALAMTRYTWRIDSLVEKVAFAEHLPATLVRLRAALGAPATRTRALELAQSLATRSLLDEETLAVALQQADADPDGTLAVALAARTVPPAFANHALRSGSVRDALTVVERLGEAFARGEDLRWAVAALGANVLRHAESYEAAPLLDKLASSGVDLTEAVRDLTAAIDHAMPYSAQFATHALVRHHMRRCETDAVLALISHSLPSVRGDAASVLVDASFVLPAAITSRLQQMTTERAWYPRDRAGAALQARALS